MVFRFANSIFEPIWNRSYIDHVQITVAETLGVEQRGGYYDTSGALRDMVQNHLFQLMSLTAMEPPVSFAADAVRDEQAKMLDAIQIPRPEEVLTRTVRGQYGEGDRRRPAACRPIAPNPTSAPDVQYRDVRGAEAGHRQLALGRRAVLPAHGQAHDQAATEIVIQFKRAPFMLFRKAGVESLATNQLVIRIQPDEGISLRFGTKVPGPDDEAGAGRNGFFLRRLFRRARLPRATSACCTTA